MLSKLPALRFHNQSSHCCANWHKFIWCISKWAEHQNRVKYIFHSSFSENKNLQWKLFILLLFLIYNLFFFFGRLVEHLLIRYGIVLIFIWQFIQMPVDLLNMLNFDIVAQMLKHTRALNSQRISGRQTNLRIWNLYPLSPNIYVYIYRSRYGLFLELRLLSHSKLKVEISDNRFFLFVHLV